MIVYVPQEDLPYAMTWEGVVYAPHPDGDNEVPEGLKESLENQTEPEESKGDTIVKIAEGTISMSFRSKGGKLYVPTPGATKKIPAATLKYIKKHRPEILVQQAEDPDDQPFAPAITRETISTYQPPAATEGSMVITQKANIEHFGLDPVWMPLDTSTVPEHLRDQEYVPQPGDLVTT